MISRTNSPISSALRRFSMLSLTFCSWPESVWMTNQLLFMSTLRSGDQLDHQGDDQIDQHGETAQQKDGDSHHHSGSLEFVSGRPGAFSQFIAGFANVTRKAQ